MMTEKKNNEISATRVLRKLQERTIKNFMDILILAALRNRDTISGPDILALIHKKFHIRISASTAYSILYALERNRLIEGILNGRKRVYKLTDSGKETIDIILDAKEKIQVFWATFFSAR